MTARRRGALVLLVGFGFVSAALAAEAALRFAGYRQPRLLDPAVRASYRLEPNAHFLYRGFLPGSFIDFENAVDLNQLGFHDADVAPERPSSATYRLMVLGDSYVAAFEVPLAATFHKRLEAALAARDPFTRASYQVIAFGQGNRAQQAELDWLRRYGPVYRPDAVLLVFFCGNDVMENSPVTFSEAARFGVRYVREVVPRKQAFFDRALLFSHSRLSGLVAEAATSFYARHLDRFSAIPADALVSPELGVYERDLAPEWQDAYDRSSALLDAIEAESARQGARLLVASLSGPQAVGDVGLAKLWAANDRRYDYAKPDRWIEEWAERHRVAHQALGPELASFGRRKAFWPHDAHLTPEGHSVVAEALYRFVTSSALPADSSAARAR